MLRLALRSVLARKRRLVSTALAVILGVAFLTGTLVFTDTMRRTFDDLFADIYRNTDTIVRSAEGVEMELGPTVRGRIPESTLETVLAVPGVATAQPSVEGFAQIVGADGEPIGNPGNGPPTFGSTFVEDDLIGWELTPGSRAPGSGEMVIDQGSADAGDLTIGDMVTVLTQTGTHQLRLVGTARFGTADSPGGASASLFDLATAQEVLLGHAGEFDAVLVEAEPGVSQEELAHRIGAVLPAGQEAITGAQMTDEQQDVMGELLGFLTTFLLVFAGIGLVVACFTIFNTFQIIVTQRLREMALLRAVGATRGQVLASQLVEAVVVGLVASVIGLAVGIGVAGALKALMGALGIDLPTSGSVLLPRTIVVAVVVGTLATVVSAVFPAWRASRTPPLAALREVAVDRSGHSVGRLVFGGLLTAGGIAAFVVGLTLADLVWVGVGALLTFLGAFVLGPSISAPATYVLGAPLPATRGISGRLARDNATRNPKRTARTGGALMVGVALVVTINMLAASAKSWIGDIVADQFTGDFVVATDTYGFGGLPVDLAARLEQLPEVDLATGVRAGFADVETADGRSTSAQAYVAVDPVPAAAMFDIGMQTGDLTALDDTGVLLLTGEAESRGLAVGDTIEFTFVDGTTRPLTVAGTYDNDELAGSFVVTQTLHESTGADQYDFSVYVQAAPGVSDLAARAALSTIAVDYPNADLMSKAEYIDDMAAQIDPIVNLMYALLALAVGIALFSIANSMALSVHERTHEIGLLRAVGMDRSQTRSAIRWEALLIALVGTLSGVLIGVFFGWALSVTLRGEGLMAFSFPVVSIVVITVLAVIGGVLAATRPARRAARLDVLRAITTE
jgi:putative ABC transport system permease protein